MSASAVVPVRAIRIIGQGPVGLALALFSRRAGVPAASIGFETAPAHGPLSLPPAMAERAMALSLGSWQLLSRIIKLPAAAAIGEVEVSLQGSGGRTHIRARELGTPALGYVTRYGPLLQELSKAYGEPADAASQMQSSDAVRGDTQARADLPPSINRPAVLIHAEGQAGEDAHVREFGQSAVLATVRAPAMPAGIALERFTRSGPVALLPLPEPAHFSLVWCAESADSGRRMLASEEVFIAELNERFGARLLDASLVGTRFLASLARKQRRQTHQGCEVWIGNAAQTLHPVAGQGLNLGLRDAFELAQTLGALFRGSALPIESAISQALAEYSRARRVDRGTTIGITDTLASVFTRGWISPAQSFALAALDLAGPVRDGFARRLMFGNR